MRYGPIACVAAALWTAFASANPALGAGRQLFTGSQPLTAYMAGHHQPLPPEASRCGNCHEAPGLSPAARTPGFGPRLNARHLMQPQARRGGPPSRYDAVSLCRALREGIDPAGVVLSIAMPRYRIDDAGCRSLWTLLTSDL